jgi:hypothetical protein
MYRDRRTLRCVTTVMGRTAGQTGAAKSADTKSKGTQMDYLNEAQTRMARSEDCDTAIAFALIAIAETLREIRDQLADR